MASKLSPRITRTGDGLVVACTVNAMTRVLARKVGRRTFAPVPRVATNIAAEEPIASMDCGNSVSEDECAEGPAAWKLYSCTFIGDQSVSLVAAACSVKALLYVSQTRLAN